MDTNREVPELVNPTSADVQTARDLLSRRNRSVLVDEEVRLVAAAVAAQRASIAGEIDNEHLRSAHDELCVSPAQHGAPEVLASLAEALLERGIVPAPDDHGGQWWLWWPKTGRGPRQRCRQVRALTRYAERFGKPYRYLCQRCRKQEIADDTAYLDEVTGVTGQPGESPQSLFARRLTAILSQVQDGDKPSLEAVQPNESEWDGHVSDLVDLLSSLESAGWELPDAYGSEFDPEAGPLLYGTATRTGMAFDFEYQPTAGELRLNPFSDICGEYPTTFSMLDDQVIVQVGRDLEDGCRLVARRAGELGLLDATHIRTTEDSDANTDEILWSWYREWIFEPAQRYRAVPMAQLMAELDQDKAFSTFFRFVVEFVGSGVLPDLIPDSAALGIAAWCWRNDTAVEQWHLPSDILMARVNIAVTRAVLPHVDLFEGVDWSGVRAALTDPAWALPDGRVISRLFGEGWPDVQRTVSERLQEWQRIDEELIGPQATLRLLTIGGSTSYTCHWWGQGRWEAIIHQIVSDATKAGLTPPPPYDSLGPQALVRDLANPDHLNDDVLDWIIDMPPADHNGPRGLRFHEAATTPIIRVIEAHLDTD